MTFYIVVFIGIIAISLASILIKLCDAPAMVIASYRLGFAAVFFLVWYLARRSNPLVHFNRRDLGLAAVSGLFLCLHFATWIASLKYTSVASSVVLVATSPVFVGIGSLLFLKERLTRLLLPGIAITVTGAFIISAGAAGAAESSVFGNTLALCGAIGAAGYYLVGRELRSRIDTAAYVTVVYSITAVLLFLLTAGTNHELFAYTPRIFLLFFLIAFVPQVIGHTSFNWALRHVSAATVSVLALGEPVGAPILAYFILGEKITAIQAFGGILILTGVGLALRGEALARGAPA